MSLASFWHWCVSVWLYSRQTFGDIYLALYREKEAQKGQDAQTVIDKRLQRQLQELRPLMGSEQTQRLRRALRICPPRKRTLEKK